MHLKLGAVAMAIACTWFGARAARAEGTEPVREAAGCARVTRGTVVRCAVTKSPALRGERLDVEAAEGRKTAVSSFLPSNPTVSFSTARRFNTASQPGTFNWYGSLSQEIEIAGQRGLRREAADLEVGARRWRVAAVRRDVAATALTAFYDALAAERLERLAGRLEKTGIAVAAVARARSESGVGSAAESDIAEAAALALGRARSASERDSQRAHAELATLVGQNPVLGPLAVEGELAPLADVTSIARSADARIREQPEVLAVETDARAYAAQAAAFRRARIPNPTVSVFAQNDGYNERVFGVGVSVPIPLPSPVGRTYTGEIAEAEAKAARARTDAERIVREIRERIAVATRAYESRSAEVATFTPERIAAAEQRLNDIADEIRAGRLAVRDAIIAQQALIDLLRAEIETRRALCFASVTLARAAGMPLEGGAS